MTVPCVTFGTPPASTQDLFVTLERIPPQGQCCGQDGWGIRFEGHKSLQNRSQGFQRFLEGKREARGHVATVLRLAIRRTDSQGKRKPKGARSQPPRIAQERLSVAYRNSARPQLGASRESGRPLRYGVCLRLAVVTARRLRAAGQGSARTSESTIATGAYQGRNRSTQSLGALLNTHVIFF